MRLRSRSEFARVGRQHSKLIGKYFLIEVRQSQAPTTRLGITVTRQYGDSHIRNRFKRVIREAFRLSYPVLPKGLDLNIRPRNGSLQLTMQDARDELVKLLC